MRWAGLLLVVLVVLVGGTARADEAADKRQASALFTEGNRLLEKGDYAGALEQYRAAYDKFKSPKILLNMGAALRQLGRSVEALDMYQQYLADPGSDPKRREEVLVIVRELSQRPGVRAVASAGNAVSVGVPRPVVAAPRETPFPPDPDPPPTVIRASTPGTRLGATLRFDVDHAGGIAGLVGPTLAVGPVELTAAAILGPTMGAYASVAVLIGRGSFRPRLAFGVPILFLDGDVAPGVHAAAGVTWKASRAVSLTLEVGVQHFPTVDGEVYFKTLFMPSLGVQAWL